MSCTRRVFGLGVLFGLSSLGQRWLRRLVGLPCGPDVVPFPLPGREVSPDARDALRWARLLARPDLKQWIKVSLFTGPAGDRRLLCTAGGPVPWANIHCRVWVSSDDGDLYSVTAHLIVTVPPDVVGSHCVTKARVEFVDDLGHFGDWSSVASLRALAPKNTPIVVGAGQQVAFSIDWEDYQHIPAVLRSHLAKYPNPDNPPDPFLIPLPGAPAHGL